MQDLSNPLPPFNPLSPAFQDDPYPVYRRLREVDPVHLAFVSDAYPMCWLLLRHADGMAALRDPRFVKEAHRVLPPSELPPVPESMGQFLEMVLKWMVFRDPPDHTRLRGLVNKAFTPRAIERLQPRIAAIAEHLIAGKLSEGGMDIITEFAFPLPVIVIAEMLGVPAEDRDSFQRWSHAILGALDLDQTVERGEQAARVTSEMIVYLRGLVAERRKRPREDILSALIAAEEQGDRLSEEELYSTCILLLFAGHETTVNLIGNGVLALLRSPAEYQKLKQNPSLVPTAVEEFLRYDSPVQLMLRCAFEDMEIGGKTIRRGQNVFVAIGAANRDPAQFPDPDRLDITRQGGRHIAFGHGIHYCIGAALARLEGEIAFRTLLEKLPALHLRADALVRRPTIAFRGLKRLPVTFHA